MHTPDAVKNWINSMAEKGLYNGETARFRVTALERLLSVMGPDEPQDAESILRDLDTLARRWATRNNGTPDTARAYVSRARGALTDYLEFQSDPTGFKGRRRGKTRDESRPRKRVAVEKVRRTQTTIAPNPPEEPKLSRFPLDEGHDFLFALPRRTLTAKDVRRIAFHLMSYAADFDPAAPQIFVPMLNQTND